jgi:hypothetical protein
MRTPATSGPPRHAQHGPLTQSQCLTPHRAAAVNAGLPEGRGTRTRTESQGRTA